MNKGKIHKKAIAGCLLAVYTVGILYVTLLCREPFTGEHLKLELFWSYKVIRKEFWQMLGNVLMFIPFGALLSVLDRRVWLALLAGFSLSCGIELLQYLLQLGLCELDDVVHNTLGTWIGWLAGSMAMKKLQS